MKWISILLALLVCSPVFAEDKQGNTYGGVPPPDVSGQILGTDGTIPEWETVAGGSGNCTFTRNGAGSYTLNCPNYMVNLMGTPPQFIGFSPTGAVELETMGGDAAMARTGIGTYKITVSKLNGIIPGGTCPNGQFVNIIDPNAVPTCAPVPANFAPLVNPPGGQNNYAPIDWPTFTGTVRFPDNTTAKSSGWDFGQRANFGSGITVAFGLVSYNQSSFQGPAVFNSTVATGPLTVQSTTGDGITITANGEAITTQQNIRAGSFSIGSVPLTSMFSGIGACANGEFVNSLNPNAPPSCGVPAGGGGGGGSVTSVTAGTGLTGGTITTTGTIALASPVAVTDGGTGGNTAPTAAGMILLSGGTTYYRARYMTGDVTMDSGGKATVGGIQNHPVPVPTAGYLWSDGTNLSWQGTSGMPFLPLVGGTLTGPLTLTPSGGLGTTALTINGVTLLNNTLYGTNFIGSGTINTNGGDYELNQVRFGGTCTAGQAVTTISNGVVPTCSPFLPANNPTFTGALQGPVVAIGTSLQLGLTNPPIVFNSNGTASIASLNVTSNANLQLSVTFPDSSDATTAGFNNMKALGIGQAANVYGYPLEITKNWNGDTGINVLNNNTGANAVVSLYLWNGGPSGKLQETGTGASIASTPPSTLIMSNDGGGGVELATTTAAPIAFVVNGAYLGQFTVTSSLNGLTLFDTTRSTIDWGSGTAPTASMASVGMDNVNLSAGSHYDGTNWRADSTNAQIVSLFTNGIQFTSDTGLTAGTSYSPTARVLISTTGLNIANGSLFINGADQFYNGTFTPMASCSGGKPAQDTWGYGDFSVSGNVVEVNGQMGWSTMTGGSGNAYITNFPFNAVDSTGSGFRLNIVVSNAVPQYYTAAGEQYSRMLATIYNGQNFVQFHETNYGSVGYLTPTPCHNIWTNQPSGAWFNGTYRFR